MTPPSLVSTWGNRPYSSPGLPCPSGSDLVCHCSAYIMDIRAFSFAFSLHIFGSASLHLPFSSAFTSVLWYPGSTSVHLHCSSLRLRPALQNLRHCPVPAIPRFHLGVQNQLLSHSYPRFQLVPTLLLPPSTPPWACIINILLGVPPCLLLPANPP